MATATKQKTAPKKTSKSSSSRGQSTKKSVGKAGVKKTAKRTATKKTPVTKKTAAKSAVKKKSTAKKVTAKKATTKKTVSKKKTSKAAVTAETMNAAVEPAAVDAVMDSVSPEDGYQKDFESLKEVLFDGDGGAVREDAASSSEISTAEDLDSFSKNVSLTDDVVGSAAVEEPFAADEYTAVSGEDTASTERTGQMSAVEQSVSRTVARTVEKKQDESSTDEIQLVCFSVASEEYGVDIYRVQEINRSVAVTALPEMPTYIQGIINLRGNVIPVFDLRHRLGFQSRDEDKDTRIIVLDYNNTLVGLTVDSVTKVLRVSRSSMEPMPRQASTTGADFLEGIIRLEDRLIMVVDCKKVVEL